MTRRLPEPGPGHTSWMAVILRITAISASAPRRAPASACLPPLAEHGLSQPSDFPVGAGADLARWRRGHACWGIHV